MLLQIAYARLIFRIRAGLCGGGLLETTARPAHLATALVRLNVDLIVTWFTPAAQAAKGATREIPIVMASVEKGGLMGYAAAEAYAARPL